MIKRPLLIRGLGIYCPNKLDINPKLIEVLICKKDENYTSLGNFELSLSSGTQVLSTEEFLFNDVIYIKFIIKSSFGGSRIYLSNVYLYEHLPGNESALPFNEYNKDKDKEKNFYNSLPSRNSEILLSDSDLTEKKNGNKKIKSNLNSNEKSNIFKLKRKNEEKDESKIILTSQSVSHKNFNQNYYRYSDKDNNNLIKEEKNFVHNLNSYEKSNIFKIKRKNEEKDESKRIILTSQSLSNHKGFNQNYYNKDSFDKDNNNNIKNEEKNPLFSSTNDNFYNSNVNNRIILEQLSNFEQNTNELMNKFDNRISNLENDLNEIKININKILENLNIIVPNSHRDILEECNKLIESKLQSSKNIYNLNTVNTINTNNFSQEEIIPSNQSNSSKNFNKDFIQSQNGKMMRMEDLLDNKLDEKLINFSKTLEKKIYKKLLKPSLRNLEEILQSSLNDVKEQLKKSTQSKKEQKKKKKHKYVKTDINYNYNAPSYREKELKLNELIVKLQNKLNMQYDDLDSKNNFLKTNSQNK